MLQNCLMKEKKHLVNGNSTMNVNNGAMDDYVQINENESDEFLDDGSLNESESKKQAQLSSLMRLAELQMQIKQLEDSLIESRSLYESKTKDCEQLTQQLNEQSASVEKMSMKHKENERTLKEHEMQIKLLNELREKDTKQHIKVLTELDAQLKKKSTDADKATHFLDQLRVKQERIQELEQQNARMEKQANQVGLFFRNGSMFKRFKISLNVFVIK